MVSGVRLHCAMSELLAALDAFLQEHRPCGELDGGVEDRRVWMTSSCGAGLSRSAAPALREDTDRALPGALC